MTVYKRSKPDARKANRQARKGQKLYVLRQVATNLAPYEDSHLYDEYEVAYRHPLLDAWMISGSLSVEGLVLRDGPVYTDKPKGVRQLSGPGPQVAGPLGNRPNRKLNARELRELEKQVDANDQASGRNRHSWW